MTTLTHGIANVATPRLGRRAEFAVRDWVNDAALVAGIIGEDEYRFGELPEIDGLIVDIGAHIGLVTVMLALDHPDATLVAVEAVPENVEMLRRNVSLNGLDSRVTIVDAAATDEATTEVPIIYDYSSVGVDGGTQGPIIDLPYVRDSRYIGNIFQYGGGEQEATTVIRPGIGLSGLFGYHRDGKVFDRIALLKIDCEGCEWQVLTSPAVSRIDRIIGEYHGPRGLGGIVRLLSRTHIVTERAGAHEGLFEAVHRG